ncbi:CMD domain protein [Microbacterium immunditiarum]|uniref:CMD domain protein n=1 Tax=Microbacterium immunditiarum TaxID=337480 RepID=A0A7Y9KMK7_9MICO|nr:CMD domain protein [Microbacterium immunditiarum]NYE21443.1 CMD domain protein [Microbacterium immunditiarum]
MTTPTVDVVDTLTGAAPDGVVAAVRSIRPVTREQLQASYDALFDPVDDAEFSLTERLLVAAFATGLTGADATADLYAERAADADAGAASVIASLVAEAGTAGPFGRYREEGLVGESADGRRFSVAEGARTQLGDRLAAALEHTHLLVYRPREAADAALQRLLDAGWTVSGIVTLSQLVAFLAFQQRVVAGLRVLEEVGA